MERLRLLVGIRFQVCFTPLIGVLFTFPSRYWSTIGRQGVFRLGGWSPHVQTGFHVPRPTQGCPWSYTYGAITRYGRPFHAVPLQRTRTTGLVHFRSPLLAESPLMSVPPGTEMFQFPRFASLPYVFRQRYPKGVGCPIRTSRDQSLLAAPPGFSQRATSFIASWRQGIHQMPFSCSHTPGPPPQGEQALPTMHRNHPRPQDTPASPQAVRRTGRDACPIPQQANTPPANTVSADTSYSAHT